MFNYVSSSFCPCCRGCTSVLLLCVLFLVLVVSSAAHHQSRNPSPCRSPSAPRLQKSRTCHPRDDPSCLRYLTGLSLVVSPVVTSALIVPVVTSASPSSNSSSSSASLHLFPGRRQPTSRTPLARMLPATPCSAPFPTLRHRNIHNSCH